MSRIASGTIHRLPLDLKSALLRSAKAAAAWNDITPIARNEWICWIVSVKKDETRREHVKRAVSELAAGKRRPCCWMGCIHRTDKPMSASQKWVLSGKNSR